MKIRILFLIIALTLILSSITPVNAAQEKSWASCKHVKITGVARGERIPNYPNEGDLIQVTWDDPTKLEYVIKAGSPYFLGIQFAGEEVIQGPFEADLFGQRRGKQISRLYFCSEEEVPTNHILPSPTEQPPQANMSRQLPNIFIYALGMMLIICVGLALVCSPMLRSYTGKED